MTDQWRRNQIEMGGGGALGLSKILTSEKKFIILVMSNFAKKGLPPPPPPSSDAYADREVFNL